jgi:uncharacterized damage-inducible protein DinB
MNVRAMYDYVVKTRRDLREVLVAAPDDVLAQPLMLADRFRCIKDMLFHIAEVEDGWIHGDIRGGPMVQDAFPTLKNSPGGAAFASESLPLLLAYWKAVEDSTHAYLDTLTPEEMHRRVAVEDWPEKHLTVDGLLWHVMIHEIRHSAQIVLLLRNAGVRPPSLDLLFYLG